MIYTGAELIVRVRNRLSETDQMFFDDQMILDALNDCQDDISADAPYTFYDTKASLTVPGRSEYLVPIARPVNCWLKTSGGQPYRLNYIEPARIDEWKSFATTQTAGICRNYTVRRRNDGQAVELFPTPSIYALIAVYGHRRPVRMTGTDSYCDLPEDHTSAAIAYAVWKLKAADEEIAQANAARSEWMEHMERVRAERSRAEADRYNLILTQMAGRYPWNL